MDSANESTSKPKVRIASSYTMREVTKILGVPAQRLRRYCRKGLIPGVRHPRFGQEYVFTVPQIDALRRAHFLSQAGFTIDEMRQYNSLGDDEESIRLRRALIGTHKRQVWQLVEDLQATIDFLERMEDELEASDEA